MTAEEKAAELYPHDDNADIHTQIYNSNKREGFVEGANWQASKHEWVSVKDRLPTEADAVDGIVEALEFYVMNWNKYRLDIKSVDKAKKLGLLYWRTPLPNNFPPPPKTEI